MTTTWRQHMLLPCNPAVVFINYTSRHKNLFFKSYYTCTTHKTTNICRVSRDAVVSHVSTQLSRDWWFIFNTKSYTAIGVSSFIQFQQTRPRVVDTKNDKMILSSVNFVKTSSRQPKSHFDFSDFIIGKIKEEQEFNDRCNKCGSPSEHVSCDLSYQSKSLCFQYFYVYSRVIMMKYSLQDATKCYFHHFRILYIYISFISMKYSSFNVGLRQILR